MSDPEKTVDADASPAATTLSIPEIQRIQRQMRSFALEYEFGLREIETKLMILRDEFRHMHDYNPIEHVSSRVKSTESIVAKVTARGLAPAHGTPDLHVIRENITDIAGVRVTCSFVPDVYRMFDLLTQQEDITVRKVKDYIAEPKPGGYRSLHAVVEVPVFLASGAIYIPVEIQFRTIAMDFWASHEHKIFYKYDGQVPAGLVEELTQAASTAAALDRQMELLHAELHGQR